MKIRYEETITNFYDENNELINTITVKTPILTPEENEMFRNKLTGELIDGEIAVGTNDSIEHYEVVEKEEEIDKL